MCVRGCVCLVGGGAHCWQVLYGRLHLVGRADGSQLAAFLIDVFCDFVDCLECCHEGLGVFGVAWRALLVLLQQQPVSWDALGRLDVQRFERFSHLLLQLLWQQAHSRVCLRRRCAAVVVPKQGKPRARCGTLSFGGEAL